MEIPVVSLDIETKCNVKDCIGKSCRHGLSPFTSDFMSAAIYTKLPKEYQVVFHSLAELKNWINEHPATNYLGQNFKFDINYLFHKDVEIPLDRWVHDTQGMAAAALIKVPKEYQEAYEARRMEINKLPDTKQTIRQERGRYGLKLMAPYFLGIDAYWERLGHESDEYVIKDAKYTYELAEFFLKHLQETGTYQFYSEYLMPWSKTLTLVERTGITLDMQELKSQTLDAKSGLEYAETALKVTWAEGLKAFKSKQIKERQEERDEYYKIKLAEDLAKRGNLDAKKLAKRKAYYANLKVKALAKPVDEFNFSSPAHMTWLLRDYFSYDIVNTKGDESTGVEVLERLSEQDDNIKQYLAYRKHNKAVTAFYDKYAKMHHNGVIYCNFNQHGTRTGRTSSSHPNMQQVPENMHKLFVARPGHLLACYDMTAIETMLIAYFTQDPILLNIIFEGHDFHGSNAKIYFPEINCHPNEVKEKYPKERAFAKKLGYALFYGAGKGRIMLESIAAGYNWSEIRCKEIADNFRCQYQTVMDFKRQLDERVKYEPISNPFGRKHFFEDLSDVYMKNFNTLVQGTASDLVQNSAHKIQTSKEFTAQVLLFVHDELVIEFSEEQRELAEKWIPFYMTDYNFDTPRGRLPLKVEGGVAKYWKK